MIPIQAASASLAAKTGRRPAARLKASVALSMMALSVSAFAQASAAAGQSPQPVPDAFGIRTPEAASLAAAPSAASDLAAASAPAATNAGAIAGLATDVKTAAASASRAPGEDPDALPWTLAPEQHPLPLHYQAPAPVTGLYLELPAEAEVKLMLPGRAADAADATRLAVSRFLTGVIGSASQARGRQLEALNQWLENTNKQEQSLSADPWARYEFSREALGTLTQFRASVAAQTQPQTDSLVEQVRAVVARIAPLVSVMQTYELRMAWYNVLVQLKEGADLFQSQVTTSDQTILASVDQYLAQHPPVSRPASTPPPRPNGLTRPQASNSVAPTPGLTSSAMQDSPRKPAATAPAPAKDQPSGLFGGALIGLFSVLTGAWLFMKFRKRGGKKAPAVAPQK